MGKTLGYGEITVANMTEPFTVMLTNEAQQFATDSNRKVTSAQSYYTDIIVIRGSQERTDYTIGNITSGSGITVSKSSKRVTFSVSAGTTIGADTGVIEIPITLDGQTVKKQFSWSCGKQGPQGVKGQDGTSIKITSKSVTYQTSTSGTTAPTGTWSITVPTVNNGQYLWTKTTVQYSDGNKTEAYSVSYKGTNGTNGTSVTVSKTEVTYQVSTSGTTAPTGTWSTIMPSCDQGQYLWTKTYVKYSDGKETTSYSVSYKGVDGEKFAFNMLRETNQGSKHWINIGASGKYSVESITTEDSINAVKLICTKPIASNEWQFCEFSDYEMLKSLKASTTYTLSYDIKTNRSGKILHNIKTGGGQKMFFANDISCKVLGNETWEHVSLKMTSGTTLPNLDRQVIYMFGDALSKVGYSIIKNLKLTEGIVDTPWAPHPGDLEGRGVSETVQYYLATSQASGVTSSTSGWSTDITTQKLTADKKYLWNCYQTKYSDGTSEPISTPKVIGVYGDKGANALQCKRNWTGTYTTINGTALAILSDFNRTPVAGDVFTTLDGSSNTGTWQVISVNGSNVNIKLLSYVNSRGEKGDNAKNLSITPSSQYFKSTDGGKTFAPDTITIKPTIQGEINFGKWQYSIDGGVSFADVVSGQKGLTISNNVLTVSKDSSLYSDAVTMVTFRAVASDSSFYDTCSIAKLYDVTDIEIGGRNLVLNSDKEYVMGYGIPNTTWTDGYAYIGLPATRLNDEILPQNNAFLLRPEAGKIYTQTIWIETDANIIDLNAAEVSWFTGKYGHVPVAAKIIKLADNSYKLTSTYTVTKGDSDIRLFDILHLFSALDISNSGTYLKFGKLKVEQGNVSTDWTPAPEDVQTAILSTKNSIDSVSSKVDTNTKSIQDKVSKTTYERELTLVKGDLSKANEGLNKWRYEIYPKSLFDSEDQSKSTIDIFARNLNLVPSQTVLLDDASLSTSMGYGDNHIAYALTFVKMSTKKDVTTKMFNDDGASLYVNGGLIITRPGEYTNGEEITFSLAKGWNCIEVVVNEGGGLEGFRFSTTLSKLSECEMMNCYYGTPVARQSRITNQLVDVTKNLTGVTSTVQDVMTAVGNSGNITEFKNNYSKWKQSVDKIETRVGEKYVTNEKFNGLEIGGRNLLTKDDCNMSKWTNTMTSWIKVTNNEYNNIISYTTLSGGWEIIYKKISVTKGQKYILSFDYKVNKAYNYLSGQKYGVYLSTSVPTNAAPANIITNGQYVIENTVTNIKRGMIAFTAPTDTLYIVINGGCIDDNQTGLSFEFNKWKLEKGNKATDWTPAHEDNEINGQNLVSNLPSNWEQGSFVVEDDSKNKTYSEVKVSEKTQIRIKELIPVFGDITISAQTTKNSSKEALNHYVILFDANKRYMGKHNVNGWNASFPRIFNCSDAKYIAIALKWGDGTKTQITPSDISQICLKIERGTFATPFTLAPEDVNGKIQSVETIATQTADKFSWLVKSGTSSSNFELTDKTATLVADKINMDGLVTFNGLDSSARDRINTVTSGNLITVTPANPKSDYGGGQTYSVIADDKGGRCVQWNSSCASFLLLNSYTPVNFTSSDQLYYDIRVPNWSSTTFDTKLTIWFYNKNKANITSASKTLTLKSTIWNHFTGYLTLPSSSNWGDLYYYIIGLTNPNKQAIGITNDSYIERVNSYATTYAKNAVDWVGQNGMNTNNMYSMVSKWTDGAVSDTTQINGGWIKANTITASKIAIGDFTNYADINESNTYWFRAEQTKEGTWFYRDGSELQRDNVISELHTCRGGEKFYVEYDISNTIKEGDEYKYAGLMIFGYDGNGGIVSYNRNAGVTATANGEITHITTQLTMPDTTRSFRVYLQIEGHVPFTGTLKIRNISVRKAVTGNLIVDGAITADKIATDAIKSRNYISSGGTQGSFLNLSDGSFTSPNLSWDSNGNLIAKNANLSGEVTATKGTIGGWNIKDSLYSNVREPYDINKYYAKKILNKPSFTNIYMSTNVLSAANYGTVGGDHVTVGDSIIATNTAYSFGVNISLGRISLFGSTYYTSDLASELNKSSSLSLSGDKISFWEYDEDGHEISEQNNTYITSNYARFSGDIFIGGDIGTDGGADIGGKLQASSIATKNGGLIETAGTIYGGGEIQCGGGQMRIIGGDYGILLRNDGSDFYILSTDSGNQWGYWNSKRPFRINLANGIPYFEYGIIIPNENYLLGNGYQMCRGTSWGGVCIGDDSKGLRFYGTSIWASHSISTSDENLKENFTTLDQYEDFYMNLNPIGFNYIGDYDGKKTHFGFGAHKTEDILESEGYDSDKFAVVTHRPLVQEDIEKRFGKDIDVDIETEYGISYTEFIALNTHMIQKTRKELETLKQEKADLESRLTELEEKFAKLNL